MRKPYYKYLRSLSLKQIESELLSKFLTHPEFKKIIKAYYLAKIEHGRQQRKSGQLYSIHLARIALTMYVSWGIKRSDLIIAGIFHDLIEDTSFGYEKIKLGWSKPVADLVLSLTNPVIKDKDSHPELKFKLRKQKLLKLNSFPRDNRLIWFFDNLDNMYDWKLLEENSPHFNKIPRWMAQAQTSYIPSAKTLGKRYYNTLLGLYNNYLKFGFKPVYKNFEA